MHDNNREPDSAVWPSRDHITALASCVRRILEAMDYSKAFVTDRTTVGELLARREHWPPRPGAGPEECARALALEASILGQRLGLATITPGDLVWMIAEQLATRDR